MPRPRHGELSGSYLARVARAAMRAYEIASGYLQHSWRTDQHPSW